MYIPNISLWGNCQKISAITIERIFDERFIARKVGVWKTHNINQRIFK